MAQKGKKQYQAQKINVASSAKYQATRTEKSPKNSVHKFGIFGLLLIALYCFVDFIPSFDTNDNMAVEWYYVSIINVLLTLFFLLNIKKYQPIIENILNQFLSKIYLIFCVIAALSIFYAINRTEAWVCYIRVLNTLAAFFNIAVLLKNRKENFIYLAILISFLLFVQCWETLVQFFSDLKSAKDITAIIYNLKQHAGNKNILAASIVIKTPLLLYCILKCKSWLKYLFSAMFITIPMTVIIINARTAYISLVLEIVFFVIIILLWYRNTKKAKTTLVNLTLVIVPTLIAFFYTQSIFANLEKQNEKEKSVYGSITQRLSGKNLTDGSGEQRIKFWEHALSYIKKNPIIGAGIGNWKLADIPYDVDTENDFSFAKHAHNDFLQIPAETGIPGGLAFYAIFLAAFINIFKTLKSDKKEEEKLLTLVSFFMIGAYMIDAVLNFPHERPVMQVYFALAMGINLLGLTSEITVPKIYEPKTIFKQIFIGILAILLVSAYYGKLNFETSKYQFVSNKELFADSNNLANFNNNDKYPGFPNLADNNYPIDVVRAFNAYHLGNYPQAHKLLNGSVKINPYSKSNEYVRALIYNKTGPVDSALHYAKTGFYTRPRNMYFFRLLSDICVKIKDSLTLQNAMLHSIPYNNDFRFLDYYIYNMINMGLSKEKLYMVINAAEKKWPQNEDIKYKRYYVNAIFSSNKGDNKTALVNLLKLAKRYPANYAYKQDIGAIYYTFKDYIKANQFLDEVLANKGSINGKAEFFKGNILLLEGKKEDACAYLKTAVGSNYPDAKRIYEANGCFSVLKTTEPEKPPGLPKKFP